LTFFFILYENSITENFNYNKDASFIEIFARALGYAAEGAFKEVAIWLQYIIGILILNLLFYMAVIWLNHLRLIELIFLIAVTWVFSFALFLLILAVLQWSLSEYFPVTCPLLIVTFYVTRREGLFIKNSERTSE